MIKYNILSPSARRRYKTLQARILGPIALTPEEVKELNCLGNLSVQARRHEKEFCKNN